MRDLQTRTNFVARKVIFKETELISSKSGSEIVFNIFRETEELNWRQKPLETEVREQITDSQRVPSAQATSHENVLHQLKHENESRDGNSDAKESEPQKKTQSKFNFSYNLAAHLEPVGKFHGV